VLLQWKNYEDEWMKVSWAESSTGWISWITTKKVEINDRIQWWNFLTTDVATEMAAEEQHSKKVRLCDELGDGKISSSPKFSVSDEISVA